MMASSDNQQVPAMQVNSERQIIDEIIKKLATEGVSALMVRRPSEDDENEYVDVLSVPAWEGTDGYLSRKAVYQFIHTKLAGQAGKGFLAAVPGIDTCDVYAYDPTAIDEGRTLNCWDVNVSCFRIGESILDNFQWDEMVGGDDTAWWEGWDMPGPLDYLTKRVANLYHLANYQIVDLPTVKPLSVQELIGILKKRGAGGSLFCHGPDYNDRWGLRLIGDDSLVLHKQSDNSLTPITQDNIDAKGRLVLDGQLLMHRCWGI